MSSGRLARSGECAAPVSGAPDGMLTANTLRVATPSEIESREHLIFLNIAGSGGYVWFCARREPVFKT
jgi:hypothetical protein